MNRLLLYIHTLRHVRPSQLFYLGVRRVCPANRPQAVEHLPKLRSGTLFDEGLHSGRSWKRDDAVEFLNQSQSFRGGQIDWVSASMPKLWRYNLHYFDYLQDGTLSDDRKEQLVSDWINRVAPGAEDAWEPYTCSLRIVNWIKWLLSSNGYVRPEFLVSLYRQASWLERNVEYHLLANHLLKNGVALVFAGMYFEGADADRWLSKGLKILDDECREQFLQDGGHFERSPMYHCICVEDLLDIVNLLRSSKGVQYESTVVSFHERIHRALDFLHDIGLPDGEIPLFNDSAFGIAPTPDALFEYAGRIMGYRRPAQETGLIVVEKSASGYYVLSKEQQKMVIDCGEIGPNYQPGHAHCDTLSYELAIGGKRLIVDGGVFDYEAGARREYLRSTRAHNTVMLDEEEQSEVWGVFRVARRAQPLYGKAYKPNADVAVFEGAHDGYHRLSGRLTHRRRIRFDGSAWRIEDYIEGSGQHHARSYVHIHPDFRVDVASRVVSIRDVCNVEWGRIEIDETARVGIEESYYCPEFGTEIKNTAIVCSVSGVVPFKLAYCIRANTPASLRRG